jgi:hypothetical protein
VCVCVCVRVCVSATTKEASAASVYLSSLISIVRSFTHTHTHTHTSAHTHTQTHTHTHACTHTHRQTDRRTDTRTCTRTTQECWQQQRRLLLQSVGFGWTRVTYRICGVGPRSIPCRCCQCSSSHSSFCPASSYRPPAEASVTVELQLPLCRKSHAAYGALDLGGP